MKKRIKVICMVGARPNFIKIVPLFEELKEYKNINPILVHTGQHYDYEMSKIFFQDLSIPTPDYNLKVGSGSHAYQMATAIKRLEPIFLKERPDLIIVVGDVNSTLTGALVAVKLHIPLAHIESGLRSYDKTMPEEVNRVLTDHISDFLFCPTKTAVRNLKKEGIKNGVYNVGDITYDTFLKNIKIATKKSKILKQLNVKPKTYLLLTLHRPSSVDDFKKIKGILEIMQDSGEKIIFPVHPRTKKILKHFKLSIKRFNNILFVKPISYLDMLILEKNAKKILTDSGGIQKEAYWFKIPCITLRKETEWVETVKDGWNILMENSKEKIIKTIQHFEPKKLQYKHWGNGKAAKKILKIIKSNFN